MATLTLPALISVTWTLHVCRSEVINVMHAHGQTPRSLTPPYVVVLEESTGRRCGHANAREIGWLLESPRSNGAVPGERQCFLVNMEVLLLIFVDAIKKLEAKQNIMKGGWQTHRDRRTFEAQAPRIYGLRTTGGFLAGPRTITSGNL